jgi:hypothetical protein
MITCLAGVAMIYQEQSHKRCVEHISDSLEARVRFELTYTGLQSAISPLDYRAIVPLHGIEP